MLSLYRPLIVAVRHPKSLLVFVCLVSFLVSGFIEKGTWSPASICRLFKCSIGEGLKFMQGHWGCDNYNHRFLAPQWQPFVIFARVILQLGAVDKHALIYCPPHPPQLPPPFPRQWALRSLTSQCDSCCFQYLSCRKPQKWLKIGREKILCSFIVGSEWKSEKTGSAKGLFQFLGLFSPPHHLLSFPHGPPFKPGDVVSLYSKIMQVFCMDREESWGWQRWKRKRKRLDHEALPPSSCQSTQASYLSLAPS